MICAILFDLGGVVLIHSYDSVSEFLARPFEATRQKAQELLDEIKEDWRRGRIDFENAAQHFQKSLKAELPVKQVIQKWLDLHKDDTIFNQKILKLIKLLRKNYKVYLLSNTMDLHWEAVKSKGLEKYFDGIFISNKIGFLKPEPEIYNHVLKSIKVKPQECVFVDDLEENVEGARKVGINGIVFTDYGDLIKKLKKFGVHISDSI